MNNRFNSEIKKTAIYALAVAVLLTLACNIGNAAPSPNATETPIVVTTKAQPPIQANALAPKDFVYLGAFRLPDDGERPRTFEYGGGAMTFNPDGANGKGSLFITGHDRLPYGELPDGGQVAEISIPTPIDSDSIDALNVAEFIQPFANVASGFFPNLDEIPRIGMAYLNVPSTGAKIHIAWGQHLQSDPPVASHAWFNPDLSRPETQGTWFIGDQNSYSVNGYMFTIPIAWADQYASGRYLATGRFKDGGLSGMGPAIFAYRPWLDDGSAPPSDTHLSETVLLLYENSQNSETFERAMNGYQHPDEWEGGAWIETSSGKSAVLFAGTKSMGDKYWYGWVNPQGAQYPCVEEGLLGQFPLCRLADGSLCPEEDYHECESHNDYRGWWSTRFDAQFILYNPDDLARVARGELQPYEPQPYAVIDIDEVLYHNPNGVELDMLGSGDQRRYRIGEVAYDPRNGFLYVLELFADGAKPIVHVWKVN